MTRLSCLRCMRNRFPILAWAIIPILAACGLPPDLGAQSHPAKGISQPITSSPVRDAKWATALRRPGLPNLHQVDGVLYRGAQPKAEGFAELKKLGIRTVICLRTSGKDAEHLAGTGIAHEHIPFHTWHPEDEDVIRFLKLVTQPDNARIFVHCRHGADRTGMMTAIYRVAVCGWSKDEAIAEMTQGGFGFHAVWQNLVNYVRRLDIDKLKREAGIDS